MIRSYFVVFNTNEDRDRCEEVFASSGFVGNRVNGLFTPEIVINATDKTKQEIEAFLLDSGFVAEVFDDIQFQPAKGSDDE